MYQIYEMLVGVTLSICHPKREPVFNLKWVSDAMPGKYNYWMGVQLLSGYFRERNLNLAFSVFISHLEEKESLKFFFCVKIMMKLTKQCFPTRVLNFPYTIATGFSNYVFKKKQMIVGSHNLRLQFIQYVSKQ